MTEIFKVKICSSPKLINDIFEFIEKSYSLRINSEFRPEDPHHKIWDGNRKIWHRMFLQMNLKLPLIKLAELKTKVKT